MKTIGLIGGIDWPAAERYYRLINREVGRRLGGLHSARMVLLSLDFAELRAAHDRGGWPGAADVLIEAARRLTLAGAEVIGVGSVPVHTVAKRIAAAIDSPLISIIAAAAAEIRARRFESVGLMGSRFTLYDEFFRLPVKDMSGARLIVPQPAEVEILDSVIYQDLIAGRAGDEAWRAVRAVADSLLGLGVEALLLADPGLADLIGALDAPVLDATEIHARALVEAALGPARRGAAGTPPPGDHFKS